MSHHEPRPQPVEDLTARLEAELLLPRLAARESSAAIAARRAALEEFAPGRRGDAYELGSLLGSWAAGSGDGGGLVVVAWLVLIGFVLAAFR